MEENKDTGVCGVVFFVVLVFVFVFLKMGTENSLTITA